MNALLLGVSTIPTTVLICQQSRKCRAIKVTILPSNSDHSIGL